MRPGEHPKGTFVTGGTHMQSTISPEAQRGRWLLAVAIAVTLLGDAIVILLTISRSGFLESLTSITRWLITAALFYAVWVGQRWARWLMFGLLGLGLSLIVPAVVRSPHPLLIGLVFQFGLALVIMGLLPSVSAFLDYQRTRRNENATPNVASVPRGDRQVGS